MTTKRTTKKAPAKAGADKASTRKPGPLRRLSDREIEAHKATSSAWGSGIVPRDETLALLKDCGLTGTVADAIIDDSIDPLGRYRMDENFRDKRLSRAELIKQAEDTAAVALELYNRVLNMDPYIRAWCISDSHRAWNEPAFPESGQHYLVRMHALMRAAAAKARSLPSKVPSRTGHRNRLLAQTAASVEGRCDGMTKARAREIAGALLECWGVEYPRDEREQRRAAKRGGRG